MPGTVAALYRYPVKGLGPQPLDCVVLTAGRALPDDRRWALARVGGTAEPGPRRWLPRGAFAQRHNTPALAAIATSYDDATTALRLTAPNGTTVVGRLDTVADHPALTGFLEARIGAAAGALRIVEAADDAGVPITFADVPDPLLSIVGVASLGDLERAVGAPVDAARLRANLWVDGLPAWHEFDWEGRQLRIGNAEVRVVAPITRCAAIDAGASGSRDLPLLATLARHFRHQECGVYAEVVRGGPIEVGHIVETL